MPSLVHIRSLYCIIISYSIATVVLAQCTPSPTPYAIVNPSFEKRGTYEKAPGWKKKGVVTFPTDNLSAYTGKKYANYEIPPDGANTTVFQQVSGMTVFGRTVLHFYFNVKHYKNTRGSGMCYIVPSLGTEEMGAFQFLAPTDGWMEAQFDVLPQTGVAPLRITAFCDAGRTFRGANIYVDDIAFSQPPSNCLFYLQISGGPVDGQYAYLERPQEDGSAISATANATEATLFGLDEYEKVFARDTGGYFSQNAFEPLGFIRPYSLRYLSADANYGTDFLFCGIPATAPGQLECYTRGDTTQPPQQQNTVFAYCNDFNNGHLYLGTANAISQAGCAQVLVNTIPEAV